MLQEYRRWERQRCSDDALGDAETTLSMCRQSCTIRLRAASGTCDGLRKAWANKCSVCVAAAGYITLGIPLVQSERLCSDCCQCTSCAVLRRAAHRCPLRACLIWQVSTNSADNAFFQTTATR